MDAQTRKWYVGGLKRRPSLHSLKDVDNATDEEVLAAIQESSANQAEVRRASGEVGEFRRYPSVEELTARLDKLLTEAAEDEEAETERALKQLRVILDGEAPE